MCMSTMRPSSITATRVSSGSTALTRMSCSASDSAAFVVNDDPGDSYAANAAGTTEAEAPAETITEEPATWQFELSQSGTDYGYVSYGEDGDWEAHRWDAVSQDTITGTGTKPVSLSDFIGLAWPVLVP